MATAALSCAANGSDLVWAYPACSDVRFQQLLRNQLKKEEVKLQSPTVITGTFQPLPPEERHDRKHESPLFLLFQS